MRVKIFDLRGDGINEIRNMETRINSWLSTTLISSKLAGTNTTFDKLLIFYEDKELSASIQC